MPTYDHTRKLTNPDYDLSDCMNCMRNEEGMCWINGGVKRYVVAMMATCKRCGYWYPRVTS